MLQKLNMGKSLLFMALFSLSLLSCNKRNILETGSGGTDTKDMQVVRLNKEAITLQAGQSVQLTPAFFPSVENPSNSFTWKNDNPEIAELSVNSDFTAVITAKATGNAKISVQNSSGRVMAECDITVDEAQQTSVQLSVDQATLLVDEAITISPVIAPPLNNPGTLFEWRVNQPEIVDLTANSDFSVKIVALKVGQAMVSLVNKENDVTVGSATITVEEESVAGSLPEPIQISLGSSAGVPAEWNPLSSFAAGTTINNLIDKEGNPTGVSITIIERFNGTNNDGAKTTNTDLDMPASVSGSSFYGNSFGEFSGALIEKSVLQIAGLNKDLKYDFAFFGSRSASDNRDTKFIVDGTNSGDASINTASNADKVAYVKGIYPDADGLIKITATAGDNNNNATGFFYFGAMQISDSD